VRAFALFPFEGSSFVVFIEGEGDIMRRFLWVTLIVLFVLMTYHTCSNREISRPPGVLAAGKPVQTPISDMPELAYDNYRLKPLAAFEIKARVILAKRYWFGRGSDLAPVDLALGWGPMSDGDVLAHFKFSQSYRFYFWSTKTFPVPREIIESHSANMHMIPGNSEIEKELKGLRPGHIVQVRGYLVEARGPDGGRWTSSLSRTDTGRGACEIIFVESLNVN
jgi:hypothetical protein